MIAIAERAMERATKRVKAIMLKGLSGEVRRMVGVREV